MFKKIMLGGVFFLVLLFSFTFSSGEIWQYNYLPSENGVSSVDSGDNCIFVSPTTGEVIITFNSSCGGSGGGSGEPLWNGNYSTFLTHITLAEYFLNASQSFYSITNPQSFINQTYANQTYRLLDNHTFNGDVLIDGDLNVTGNVTSETDFCILGLICLSDLPTFSDLTWDNILNKPTNINNTVQVMFSGRNVVADQYLTYDGLACSGQLCASAIRNGSVVGIAVDGLVTGPLPPLNGYWSFAPRINGVDNGNFYVSWNVSAGNTNVHYNTTFYGNVPFEEGDSISCYTTDVENIVFFDQIHCELELAYYD